MECPEYQWMRHRLEFIIGKVTELSGYQVTGLPGYRVTGLLCCQVTVILSEIYFLQKNSNVSGRLKKGRS